MKDIHFITPPYIREDHVPLLGVPQLCAWLRKKGFSASQSDLHAQFAVRFNADGKESKNKRYFLAPSRPEGEDLWNPTAHSYPIKEVLASCGKPPAAYAELYEKSVKPKLRDCRCAGFSVMSPSQIAAALYFAMRAKKDYPGIKTAMGGAWVSCSWNAFRDWPELFKFIDYFIGYAGELPLEALLGALKNGKPPGKVPSLARLAHGKVVQTPLAPRMSPEDIPAPDFDDIDLSLYSCRALPYQSATGCEWGRCKFCGHVFPGNDCASKSMDKMMREIRALNRKYHPDVIQIIDLATPLHTLEEFSRRILECGEKIHWFAAFRANMGLTPELAKQLAASGCILLGIGLETAGKEGLKILNKGITMEAMESTLSACHKAGIGVVLSVMNYPGQSEKEFRDTLAYTTARREKIYALGIQRFALSRWLLEREPWYGKVANGYKDELNSFTLPFHGKGIDDALYYAMAQKARRSMIDYSRCKKKPLAFVFRLR
jgi:hypothetical protein